jgi:hypothetical protein
VTVVASAENVVHCLIAAAAYVDPKCDVHHHEREKKSSEREISPASLKGKERAPRQSRRNT